MSPAWHLTRAHRCSVFGGSIAAHWTRPTPVSMTQTQSRSVASGHVHLTEDARRPAVRQHGSAETTAKPEGSRVWKS